MVCVRERIVSVGRLAIRRRILSGGGYVRFGIIGPGGERERIVSLAGEEIVGSFRELGRWSGFSEAVAFSGRVCRTTGTFRD